MRKNSKPRKAFFTCSGRVLKKPNNILDIISVLEEKCGLNIEYRWFEAKTPKSSRDIYTDSVQEILKADIFVAEASVSSTGVGQQIAYALQHKKPCFLLMNSNLVRKNNQFFLKGTTSSLMEIIFYKDLQDLEVQLFSKIKEVDDHRLEKFNFLASRKIKDILYEQSDKEGISVSELLRRIVLDWADNNTTT